MVMRRHPETVEAQQLLVIVSYGVAVDVDAHSFFLAAVEDTVLQPESDCSRRYQLLAAAGFAPHLGMHYLLCHVSLPPSEAPIAG